VIVGLEVGEFQSACRRDHDHAGAATNFPPGDEFCQRREGDARVRTREKSGAIGACRRISQLVLGCLLDHAV
jgi:hypothetical protein